MTPLIGLWQALRDTNLLGEPFQAGSFWTWKTVAKLIDGIPLRDENEIELFRQCTGRRQVLTKPALKHRHYTREAIEERRQLRALLRQSRMLLQQIDDRPS